MSSPTEIMLVAIATSTCFSSLKGSANRRFASETSSRIDPARQLDRLVVNPTPIEQSRCLSDALSVRVAFQPVAHFILNQPPCAAEFAKAIEIPNQRQIGIGWVFESGRLSLRSVFFCNAEQRQVYTQHGDLGASSLCCDSHVQAGHCVRWMASSPRRKNYGDLGPAGERCLPRLD